MGNNLAKQKMKKYLLMVLLVFAFIFAFAVPNGCYEGVSGPARGRCAVHISGSVISCLNKNGDVIARWTIVSEDNGNLSVRSDYGVTQSASWWREDGKVYLKFNYQVFTLMK
jgi:hypothetical protein